MSNRDIIENPSRLGMLEKSESLKQFSGLKKKTFTIPLAIGASQDAFHAILKYMGFFGFGTLKKVVWATELYQRTEAFGRHGRIYYFRWRGGEKKLKDGTVIKRGDVVGSINLVRNAPDHSEITNENLIGITRDFLIEVLQDFIELGNMVNSGDIPSFKAIKGESHLASASLAKLLDFDINESPSLLNKLTTAFTGSSLSTDKFSFNLYKNIQHFRGKFRRSNEIYISKEALVKNRRKYMEIIEKFSH